MLNGREDACRFAATTLRTQTFEARTLKDMLSVLARELGQRWVGMLRERYQLPF